jgi:hypothetical protein
MATMLMEMEKVHVSSVFFQRLALKRKERGVVELEPSGGRFLSAARSMRASGAGFMSKVGGVFRKGKKGEPEPDSGLGSMGAGRPRPRPPSRRRSTADDDGGAVERAPRRERASSDRAPKGASFAQKSQGSSSSAPYNSAGIFQPKQATNVSFVQHIPSWGASRLHPNASGQALQLTAIFCRPPHLDIRRVLAAQSRVMLQSPSRCWHCALATARRSRCCAASCLSARTRRASRRQSPSRGASATSSLSLKVVISSTGRSSPTRSG